MMGDMRCRGLRNCNIGGPVTVRDFTTGRVKCIIENPPTFDDIIAIPENVKRRIHKKHRISPYV
jgi:hypothetical protein